MYRSTALLCAVPLSQTIIVPVSAQTKPSDVSSLPKDNDEMREIFREDQLDHFSAWPIGGRLCSCAHACVHSGLEGSASSAMGALARRNSTGPEIFGTQPQAQKTSEGVRWTLEPYNRTAIADAIRKDWCVIPLEEQERMIRNANQGKPLGASNIRDCR
jgi:hypothetical protein